MKKLFIITLSIVLVIFGFLTLPWTLIYVGMKMSPDPPMPEITYEKFPFRLEYKINGQRKVIENTVICEYDGVGMNEAVGKFRKWKSKLASGDKDLILLKIDNTKELVYPLTSPDYYMGDSQSKNRGDFREAKLNEKSGEMFSSTAITAEELLDKYNIEIISWNDSKPIINKFR